jgi:CO/xanthine dehydrogenase Mo-binding subunit
MIGHPEESLVCLLAILTRQPVKWVESRDECLIITGREQVHRVEVAFTPTGKVVAFRDHFVANVGAPYSTPGWGMAPLTASTMPCGYDIQTVEIDYTLAVTNKGPWTASRGYGKEASNIVMERVMDLVARDLKLDPAEIRRRNLIPRSAFPYRSATGLHIDSGDYHAALEEFRSLLGVHAKPQFAHVRRWPNSMPQYAVGHLDRVRKIRERAATLPGLFLAGAYLDGVGIPDCVRHGETAAEAAFALIRGSTA